jgi:hypothetical protein
MTESDWFESIYPDQMLTYLGDRASPRKRCLLACACVRRIWSLLGDDRLHKAVKIAERFADGQVSAKALKKARRLTIRLRKKRESEELQEATWTARAARAAAQAVEAILQEEGPILFPPRDIREPPDVVTATRTARTAARAAEAQVEREPDVMAMTHGADVHVRRLASLDAAELVREIFGNPFRPVTLDPRWLDWNESVVPRIARVIYRKRCFRNMPILADALEEAGCNDEELLMHCRASVEHVRGCWVVDLLRGMS